MKKLGLLVLLVLFIVGCDKQHSNSDPIKIGAILELTGSMPLVGASGKNAAEMAAQEVNDQGGLTVAGKKRLVRLIIEDNANNPEQSAAAAKKLIKQDRVLAIVGPNISTSVIPAANIAEDTKTLLISPWSSAIEITLDPKTGEYRHYVFRTSFADSFEGRVLANFARYTKNYKTAAILYDTNAKEPALQAAIFKTNFEKLGGKVVVFASYKKPSKDLLQPSLTAIKTANPQVLFLPDYYNNLPLIVQQARQLGIHAELLGSDNWNRLELLSSAHGLLENAYFTSHYSPDDRSAVTQKFVKNYQQRYGKIPDDVAALTYDAYQLLFKAITTAHSLTSQAVRDSLWALPIIEGVTGTINYVASSGGEPRKSAVIVQIKGNKLVWVTHANP